MSRLGERMMHDVDIMFRDAGEAVTYVSNGEERSIVAIAEIGTNDTKKAPHNLDRSYGDASFTVKDDAESGVTEPHAGDEIRYGGGTYTFVNVEQHKPGVLYRLRFLSHESAVRYSSMW